MVGLATVFHSNAGHKWNVISARTVFQSSALSITARYDIGGFGGIGICVLPRGVGGLLPVHASRSTRPARDSSGNGLADDLDSRVRRRPT